MDIYIGERGEKKHKGLNYSSEYRVTMASILD